MEHMLQECFFATLTYNNESLPVINLKIGDQEEPLAFAYRKDVQDMFKRIRKDNLFKYPFRYFAVSELGSRYGRPHFHILFFFDKSFFVDDLDCITFNDKVLFPTLLDQWKRNIGSTRKPVYRPLCTYVKKWNNVLNQYTSTFDCHYVQENRFSSDKENDFANVAFYVCKYMMKTSNQSDKLYKKLKANLADDDFHSVWSLVKPTFFKSLDFGQSKNDLIINYLKDCIDKSFDSPYPLFFNPQDGQSFPLARFYRSKGTIYPITEYLDFYSKQDPEYSPIDDDMNYSELLRFLRESDRKTIIADNNNEDLYVNQLLNELPSSGDSLDLSEDLGDFDFDPRKIYPDQDSFWDDYSSGENLFVESLNI